MGCIEASAYTTGTILGTHQSLDECTEQCGVCCVPTCPSDFTTYSATSPDGCVYQTLINIGVPSLNTLFNQCSIGGYDDLWHVATINANDLGITEPSAFYDIANGVPNSFVGNAYTALAAVDFSNGDGVGLNFYKAYSLTRNGTKPAELTWAAGYPSGTYFIESRRVVFGGSIGGQGVGVKDWYIEPCGTMQQAAGTTCNLGVGLLKEEIKYFQCVDGVLIDKTPEAFANGSDPYMVNVFCEGLQAYGTLTSKDAFTAGGNTPCGVLIGEGIEAPCCPDYDNDGECPSCPGWQEFLDGTGPYPCDDYPNGGGEASSFLNGFPFFSSLPSEMTTLHPSISDVGTEGITSLVYECYDQASIPSIGQSGCLQGGVLTPSGIPAGVWHSGQNCTIFDCNA
jgi:hypothetical protein